MYTPILGTGAWNSLVERGIFVYETGDIDPNRTVRPDIDIYQDKAETEAAFQRLLDEGDPAAVEIVARIARARLLGRTGDEWNRPPPSCSPMPGAR